jgi:hypothetical protein
MERLPKSLQFIHDKELMWLVCSSIRIGSAIGIGIGIEIGIEIGTEISVR